MAILSVAPDPACPSNAYLAWDTVWSNDYFSGDWERDAFGALSARRGIATCVILALFTDKRCPADHPLAHLSDGDLRGWWATPLFAAAGLPEMGSLLWLLERASCTEENRRYAELFALDALQPLIAARLAVRAFASAEFLPQRNGVRLAVSLYGADGATVYAREFDVVWSQIVGA